MKVETENAAQVLTGYVWKSIHENKTPNIELINNKLEINQDELLKYVMRFQQYLIDKEKERKQEEINNLK